MLNACSCGTFFYFAWNNTQYLCGKVPWPSSFQNGYRKKKHYITHSIHISIKKVLYIMGGSSKNSIGDDFQQYIYIYTCKLKHLTTDPFRKRIPTDVAMVSSSPCSCPGSHIVHSMCQGSFENFLQMAHRLMRRAQHQTRLIASAQDVGSLKLTMEVGLYCSANKIPSFKVYFPIYIYFDVLYLRSALCLECLG